MKISESASEPLKMQLPNGMIKDGRMLIICFKVENDKDATELVKLFSEGIELVCISNEYIFMKKFVESKIALPEVKK